MARYNDRPVKDIDHEIRDKILPLLDSNVITHANIVQEEDGRTVLTLELVRPMRPLGHHCDVRPLLQVPDPKRFQAPASRWDDVAEWFEGEKSS